MRRGGRGGGGGGGGGGRKEEEQAWPLVRKRLGAKCQPYIRLWRSAGRARLPHTALTPFRFSHQPHALAVLRLPVTLASLPLHGPESERFKQHAVVVVLNSPVPEWIHGQVRESGGSTNGSPGSRGSRAGRGALRGIAFSFTPLLPGRRHLTDGRTGRPCVRSANVLPSKVQSGTGVGGIVVD